MKDVLVIGCGYSGERLAMRHRERGDTVFVTSRDPARFADLAESGIKVIETGGQLPRAQRVYYTVPPAEDRLDLDPRLDELLSRLPVPEVFVYFSTTGVYGDCGGATVSEDSPATPRTDRARRRLAAERQVEEWCRLKETRSVILRIAGIYGPGRLPVERLLRTEPVPDPADTGPGNRIHVDDLVDAAVIIADSSERGTWNISDGNPLSTAAFNDLVAAALGLPAPARVPLDSTEISPGMRSFLRERRRIDNARLLGMPGFRLRYPDPSDGIRASLT